MIRVVNILSLLLLMTGCAIQRTPVVDTVTVTVERVRDSIVVLEPDSGWIMAYFECDSLNHAIMTELEEMQGEKLRHETVYKDGVLRVSARIDSQAIYLAWKERHDTTTIQTVVTEKIEVEKIVKKIPRWLLWTSGAGVGTIIFLVILIILKRI